jgi:hypothetical protein
MPVKSTAERVEYAANLAIRFTVIPPANLDAEMGVEGRFAVRDSRFEVGEGDTIKTEFRYTGSP